MPAIDLGKEDEGYQEFNFNNTTIRLDVYDVCKTLAEFKRIHEEFPNTQTDWIQDTTKFLEDKGLQGISRASTVKFVKYINELASELKKNIESNVLLPPPTAA